MPILQVHILTSCSELSYAASGATAKDITWHISNILLTYWYEGCLGLKCGFYQSQVCNFSGVSSKLGLVIQTFTQGGIKNEVNETIVSIYSVGAKQCPKYFTRIGSLNSRQNSTK